MQRDDTRCRCGRGGRREGRFGHAPVLPQLRPRRHCGRCRTAADKAQRLGTDGVANSSPYGGSAGETRRRRGGPVWRGASPTAPHRAQRRRATATVLSATRTAWRRSASRWSIAGAAMSAPCAMPQAGRRPRSRATPAVTAPVGPLGMQRPFRATRPPRRPTPRCAGPKRAAAAAADGGSAAGAAAAHAVAGGGGGGAGLHRLRPQRLRRRHRRFAAAGAVHAHPLCGAAVAAARSVLRCADRPAPPQRDRARRVEAPAALCRAGHAARRDGAGTCTAALAAAGAGRVHAVHHRLVVVGAGVGAPGVDPHGGAAGHRRGHLQRAVRHRRAAVQRLPDAAHHRQAPAARDHQCGGVQHRLRAAADVPGHRPVCAGRPVAIGAVAAAGCVGRLLRSAAGCMRGCRRGAWCRRCGRCCCSVARAWCCVRCFRPAERLPPRSAWRGAGRTSAAGPAAAVARPTRPRARGRCSRRPAWPGPVPAACAAGSDCRRLRACRGCRQHRGARPADAPRRSGRCPHPGSAGKNAGPRPGCARSRAARR